MCNINTPHTARCADVLQAASLIYFVSSHLFFIFYFNFTCSFNSITPWGAIQLHLFLFHLLKLSVSTVTQGRHKQRQTWTCAGGNCGIFCRQLPFFFFFFLPGDDHVLFFLFRLHDGTSLRGSRTPETYHSRQDSCQIVLCYSGRHVIHVAGREKKKRKEKLPQFNRWYFGNVSVNWTGMQSGTREFKVRAPPLIGSCWQNLANSHVERKQAVEFFWAR